MQSVNGPSPLLGIYHGYLLTVVFTEVLKGGERKVVTNA